VPSSPESLQAPSPDSQQSSGLHGSSSSGSMRSCSSSSSISSNDSSERGYSKARPLPPSMSAHHLSQPPPTSTCLLQPPPLQPPTFSSSVSAYEKQGPTPSPPSLPSTLLPSASSTQPTYNMPPTPDSPTYKFNFAPSQSQHGIPTQSETKPAPPSLQQMYTLPQKMESSATTPNFLVPSPGAAVSAPLPVGAVVFPANVAGYPPLNNPHAVHFVAGRHPPSTVHPSQVGRHHPDVQLVQVSLSKHVQ
jgi:hypothetical protein